MPAFELIRFYRTKVSPATATTIRQCIRTYRGGNARRYPEGHDPKTTATKLHDGALAQASISVGMRIGSEHVRDVRGYARRRVNNWGIKPAALPRSTLEPQEYLSAT